MTFLASLTLAIVALLSFPAAASQHLVRGQFILIDTEDQAQCLSIKKSLAEKTDLKDLSGNLKYLCVKNPQQPIASILVAQSMLRDTMQAETNAVYLVQRHGPNTPLRDSHHSTLSFPFFWEQEFGADNSLKSFLTSPSKNILYFELFKNLQSALSTFRPKVSLPPELNSDSVEAITPKKDTSDSLNDLFKARTSKRSRVRLLTRDPLQSIPTLNPPSEQTASLPDFQFNSEEGKVRQTIDALQQYFLRESYWGFELQFRY